MRMHFDELFNVTNGRITPNVMVRIGGVTMGPGVSFGGGVSFSGVDLTQFVGKYLDVNVKGNVYNIEGVYN